MRLAGVAEELIDTGHEAGEHPAIDLRRPAAFSEAGAQRVIIAPFVAALRRAATTQQTHVACVNR
jgi:hypothetical protein